MTTPRVVLTAGLLVLARVLDVSVLARLPLPAASPDLTLLVVVAMALLAGSVSGASVGVCAGLLADLAPPASDLLGASALAYGLAGAAAGRLRRTGEQSVVQPVVAVVAAVAVATTVPAALAVWGVHGRSAVSVLAAVLVGSVYALPLAGVVLPAVAGLDRRIHADPW